MNQNAWPNRAPSSDSEKKPLLTVDRIVMRFGGLFALSDVSLEVKAGSVQALIGPNGSGKTTLFNLITGVYKPSSGAIRFDGEEITRLSPHRITALGIARNFQNIQLFNQMTVLENVKVGTHCRSGTELLGAIIKLKRARDEERKIEAMALEILDFLNLTDQKDQFPKNLSYGQQRLVELGRALASKPKMLLLDEPSAGMNAQDISLLMEYIERIHDRGCTIFLVEHHMKLVMKMSQRITVLSFGKKIAEGIPSEIQSNPKVIEAYLGTGAGF